MPSWPASGPSIRASLPAEPEVFQSRTLNPYLKSASTLPPAYQDTAFEPPKQGSAPSLLNNGIRGSHSKSNTASEAKRSSSPIRSSAASIPSIPRSISQAIGQSKSGQDSPVMNETLSVIDEHITDLSTPRHSLAVQEARTANDSASDYSNHLDSRVSYVAGPETDDEEEEMLSEANVMKWSPRETADYLRQIGVDPTHCDIFQEQEISGDVLLEMDQEFIYMKEYNFGLMGRRLKTWHKIRQFQEQVKGIRRSREHSASYATTASDDLESRIDSTGSILPRIPSLMEKSEQNSRALQHNASYADAHKEHIPAPLQPQSNTSSGSRSNMPIGSSLSSWHGSTQESPSRPSAASIRQISHTRRHSSLDIGTAPVFDPKARTGSLSGKFSSHTKQGSFDRNWSMGTNTQTSHSHPDNANLTSQLSQKKAISNSDLSASHQQPSADLDRGYFSGPESDSKPRNFLRKRDGTGSAAHSRHSSFVDQQKRELAAKNRHSRYGSADSVRDTVPAVTSPAAQAYHSKSFRSRFRSASARTASGTTHNILSPSILSPTVTNLEDGKGASLPIPSPRPESEGSGRSSPLLLLSGKSSAKQKRFGLRAISDAVTGNEKAILSSPTSIPSSFKDTPLNSPSRTGSSTPSGTSRSLDIDNPDSSVKDTEATEQSGPPRTPGRAKTKTKKDTSAYTRGLEKKSPADQRAVCDHSGWMKKKSSSLMTTWKPRLFFLRGRRLSYYYSEDDTEERGVIDISSHKVLRADQDPFTNLHATITGSASNPISQSSQATSNSAGATNSKARMALSGGPFIFKLIPPKAGLPRAVQFTKPTIHYFQVDSVHEGRKWMAALMKATISYDPAFGMKTTNEQKTISLAKARARKERPPALKSDDEAVDKILAGPKSDEAGLLIRGLSFDSLDKKEEEERLSLNGIATTAGGGTHKQVASTDADRSASRTTVASETVSSHSQDGASET